MYLIFFFFFKIWALTDSLVGMSTDLALYLPFLEYLPPLAYVYYIGVCGVFLIIMKRSRFCWVVNRHFKNDAEVSP